jgi:hypothetical protein
MRAPDTKVEAAPLAPLRDCEVCGAEPRYLDFDDMVAVECDCGHRLACAKNVSGAMIGEQLIREAWNNRQNKIAARKAAARSE